MKTRSRLRATLTRYTYLPDTQNKIITTNVILTIYRFHSAQDIGSLLNNLRWSQHSRMYTTQYPNRDPHKDNHQHPLIHMFHNFARVLKIRCSQHSLVNLRWTITYQYAWYPRTATLYPYLVLTLTTLGNSHMCDLYALQ